MSGSVQPELLHAVTAAFSGLWRAVRAVALYQPDHPQVRPFAAACAEHIQECCRWGEPLIIDLSARTIELMGSDLSAATGARLTLLARLHADGLRQMHFRSTFDLSAALTLAATLAPYQSPDQAPLESVTDRLHWKPLPGLAFVVHGRSAIAGDEGSQAERDWEDRVGSPRAMPGVAHLPDRTRLAAVWDGTRGRIPWPPPVRPGAIQALEQEVEEVDRAGVTSLRVGQILADLVDIYAVEPDLRRVFERLTSGVDQRLMRSAPAEASALLQPLARWAEQPTSEPNLASLRLRTEQFLGLLLDPTRLTLLMAGAQRQTMSPESVAAWFAALPRRDAARALDFAASLPAGPYRAAILHVVAFLTAGSPELLVTAVRERGLGPALLAFELSEPSEDPQTRTQAAIAAAQRPEPILALRGARALLADPSPQGASAMIELLSSANPELVLLASTFVTRTRAGAAGPRLESMVGAASFTQRSRAEQIALCVAFGAARPAAAATLARRKLGPSLELVDVERSAAWILCLAAAGGPEGIQALPALLAPRLALEPWVAEVRGLLTEGGR